MRVRNGKRVEENDYFQNTSNVEILSRYFNKLDESYGNIELDKPGGLSFFSLAHLP